MAACILVVEDNAAFRGLVADVLERAGYRVLQSDRLDAAEHLFSKEEPQLVVADVILPDGSGLDLCRKIRAHQRLFATPIIVLTTEAGMEKKAAGFEAGADQYLVKPFEPKELVLWVQALLRRLTLAEAPTATITAGDLSIDVKAHMVRYENSAVARLTVKEFDLLCFLVKKRPQVVSRKQILSQLWHTIAVDHVVDTHLSNLRRKLPKALADRLQAIPGKGFRYLE